MCQLIRIRVEFGEILLTKKSGLLLFKIIRWILYFVTLCESCRAIIIQLNQHEIFLQDCSVAPHHQFRLANVCAQSLSRVK